MPNSCSLSAQKRDRTKSQLVKSAVKNGPTLILKFYYLIYTAQETVQGTRYKVQGTRVIQTSLLQKLKNFQDK